MNTRVTAVWIFLLSFATYSLSGFAQCSGGGPKPEWVDSPESVTDKYFFAAGVSDDTKAPMSDRISSAKQNALRSISELINVSVKNSLVLEQSQRQNDGRVLTDSNFKSITQTSTSASLKNVEVIATWEDSKSCALWVRARVSKQHVEQGKREGLAKMLFGVLNEQLALAQNESAPLDKRVSAVDTGLDVLSRIPLELIPEASTAAYYRQLLTDIQQKLGLSRNDLNHAKKILADADALLNKAVSQTNENAKSKTLASAASGYKDLLSKYNNGLSPLFGPGDIFFKLGEVEEARRNSCGAKNYYQQSADSKHLNGRQPNAQRKANSLACSADDMEKALWRQHFEGRAATIVCYYQTKEEGLWSKTEQGVWQKACDGLNNIVKPLGADTTIKTQKLTSKQMEEFQGGGVPVNLIENGKLLLGVIASGKMINRIDNESPGKNREYQFEGGMSTFLVEDGKTLFTDRFQGKTGWNPVSQQMVLDVLAINVVKRWREKFSKFLRHETD